MERVLIVGCGGIGGIVGAHLVEGGSAEVTVLSSNTAIAEAVNAQGFELHDSSGVRKVPGRVHTELSGAGPFDFIVLATQPPDVEAAARQALPSLADGGAFVVLQNGLCEHRIAAIAGPEAVLGGVVMWGGSMEAPGVYTRTSRGGFVLGRMHPGDDPRLGRLAELLAPIGPVRIREDFAAARWAKLAFNCAISTLGTIGGDRVGPLLRTALVRTLALEVLSEVVEVARAEGVKPAKLAGALDLEWIALTDAERAGRSLPSLVVKHGVLLAVGARYRRLRSSMLRAIERGRAPAVDFLNGEVVDAAARHGLEVPVNAAAQELVHAIAAGRMQHGVDALRVLHETAVEPKGARRSA